MLEMSNEKIAEDYGSVQLFFLHKESGVRDGPTTDTLLNGKIVDSDGVIRYYLNGKLHNKERAAVVYPDGDKEWFLNGKRHRLNGPALILETIGMKAWYIDGELHRDNGPAVIWSNGSREWYLRDKQYNKTDYLSAKGLLVKRGKKSKDPCLKCGKGSKKLYGVTDR